MDDLDRIHKYWLVKGPGYEGSFKTAKDAHIFAYSKADENPGTGYEVLEVRGYYQTPKPQPKYKKL